MVGVVVVVGSVKGRLRDANLFLVNGTRVRVRVARRRRAGGVDGGLYADIFLVAGGVTGAVFTFNHVNRAVVRTVFVINLNVTVGLGRVGRSRPFGRSEVRKRRLVKDAMFLKSRVIWEENIRIDPGTGRVNKA